MRLLGFDLYLSRGLYGARGAAHFDLYRMEHRWYFLEVGSWTLEVTTPCSPARLVALPAVAVPLAAYPDAALAVILNLFHFTGT